MMKKHALFLALLGCGSLIAQGPRWETTLDYLYWKPFNLTLNASLVTDGVRANRGVVDPTFNPGVRGELRLPLGCDPISFVGRYYWVDCRQKQTFRGDGNPSLLRYQVKVYYQTGDLLVSYKFCPHRCLTIEALAGAKVLYLANDTVEDIQFTSSLRLAASHRRFAGGGAALGALLTWSPGCALDLFAEGQYGGLAGSRLSTSYELDTSPSVTGPSSFGTWTREMDLRIGGRFHRRCGYADIGLELGWEARSYLEYPSTIPGNSGAGAAMGGLFVGLSASF